MTIHKISTYRGKTAKMHYFFREHLYEGVTAFRWDEIKLDEEGKRFFIQVSLCYPENYLEGDKVSVPSWFTLEAPYEGWETVPTKMELYRMMVQDSIAKGLKTDTLIISER